MACGKKSNNAPTEEFILASPAPVDVAAKISAIYRELSEKVSLFLIEYRKSNWYGGKRGLYTLHFGCKYFILNSYQKQEKDRALDLMEASRFSEEICNDLVSIGSTAESPGKNWI